MNKLSENTIEMKGIKKSFSGVEVLHGVDILVKQGEVHALMGENGAGKSTLVKILMGEEKLDEGSIWCQGQEVRIQKPADAHRAGLSMIHQELSLISELSITENIFAGRELRKYGIVQRKKQNETAKKILESVKLDLDPRIPVRELQTAQMQMVEIAEAVSFGAKLIVMDEPTSSITQKEMEVLFGIIKKLKQQGISFIYISHRLEEVFNIADQITVLRDGALVGSGAIEDFTEDSLISMMVGRTLNDYYPKRQGYLAESPVLEVRNLSRRGEFQNVSFDLYPGEILGLGGLVGAGRTELANVLFGLNKSESGEVRLNGEHVKIQNPRVAIKNGLALVPEDRKITGLNLIGSITENIMEVVERKHSNHCITRKKVRRLITMDTVKKLSIKINSVNQSVGKLSGGNQQKVVLGKWLLNEPEILILDEPTRGIDVGSKSEIYKLISQMASEGKAILFISSEMPELIGMCDRIAILSEGKLTGILEKEEVSQESIMKLATKSIETIRN